MKKGEIEKKIENEKYIYEKSRFFDFFNYMYEYSDTKKSRIPLNQIIKEYKFYFLNIEKITENSDEYDKVINYSIKDLKKDLKNYIGINSRYYNNLSPKEQEHIKCYYDLDTIINNQRGAICKIHYKRNIIIIDDKIIDTSLYKSK